MISDVTEEYKCSLNDRFADPKPMVEKPGETRYVVVRPPEPEAEGAASIIAEPSPVIPMDDEDTSAQGLKPSAGSTGLVMVHTPRPVLKFSFNNENSNAGEVTSMEAVSPAHIEAVDGVTLIDGKGFTVTSLVRKHPVGNV